ncbi:lytic transglycosylase domain-containing protein [bacterium]|nr:lytic transglycosylase domain-containing protein [bacterium]
MLLYKKWFIYTISFLSIGVIAFFPYPVRAKIYKYTDSDGVTHYSDRPFYADYCTYPRNNKVYFIQPDSAEEMILDRIIMRVSRIFDMDPALIKAIIKAESDFNPNAISVAGARGLMQLMPQTACIMDVKDPFDPEDNITGGTRYLKYLLNRFDNDLEISLAAYNAGETAVIKNGGIPEYKETMGYVQKVLKYYSHYKKQAWLNDTIFQFVDKNNVLHITNTSGSFLERSSHY